MSRTDPDPALAGLLDVRSRAREAFRLALLRLQVAATSPEGVTRALEDEMAALRAAWKRAEADVQAFRARDGDRRAPP